MKLISKAENPRTATRVSAGTGRLFEPDFEGDGAVSDVGSTEDGDVVGELVVDGEVVGVPDDGETAFILSFLYINIENLLIQMQCQ